MAYITQRRRPVRRSSVRVRRTRSSIPVRTKHYNKFSRLKYSRILFLIALFFVGGWAVLSIIRLLFFPATPQSSPASVSTVQNRQTTQQTGVVYNVKTAPNLISNQDLQTAVNGAVDLAKTKGLPTEALSITLIDVSKPTAHAIAGFNNTIPRFPASVSKLYWMVAFFGYAEKGFIPDESPFYTDLSQMMRISDNDAASRIVDAITQTESGDNLEGKSLENWIKNRSKVNDFFDQSGYEGINLTTKNYPITGVGEEPTGRDLQLREKPPYSKGNLTTTDQTARLMYEIYTKQAISPLASTKMAYLLTRDLNPQAWQNIPANSVKGFLGESLPPDIYYGSKVGYTSRSRQEVAFVRTLNDNAIYILAVFGDDPAYAKDEEIFPKISRYIFDRLNQNTLQSSPEKVTQLSSLTFPMIGIDP